MSSTGTVEALRDDWLQRLSTLTQDVREWANRLGWSTRVIDLVRSDSVLGSYRAPALLMQDEGVRILMEPIARTAPGVDGVVDLYLMPAYDDIASLYFREGLWYVEYAFTNSSDRTAVSMDTKALSMETLKELLEAMKEHAI